MKILEIDKKFINLDLCIEIENNDTLVTLKMVDGTIYPIKFPLLTEALYCIEEIEADNNETVKIITGKLQRVL